MTVSSVLFAAAALIPAITSPAEGTPQGPLAGALVVALCGGGAIALSLGDQSAPPATPSCCCAKGCRTGKKRGRADRRH
jgi:hypothetical protein